MDTSAKAVKPHPMTEIKNIRIELLEKAVYSRQYEKAGNEMLDSLRKLKGGAEFIGYSSDPSLKVALYTRYAAAVFTLLADPAFHLSQDGMDALAGEHAILDIIFRSSAFGTSDHMLAQITSDPMERDPAKLNFTDASGLLKFLLTYSLRSGYMMNFEELFKRNPQTTFALYVGFLTTLMTTSQTAHERKELLLGLSHLFEDVQLTNLHIAAMSDAYMYCSYGTRRDKHAFKGLMHRLYAKMMHAHGFVETVCRRPRRAKPIMLVPVEWFTSLHAMFRCYAPIMRQLRTKFRLIGFGRSHSIDEEAVLEFDEWLNVPDEIVLDQVIERVRTVMPDVIYYPSLGMDLTWVALASVRLAPIQIMTLGHPASSQSPCIDYVICEQGDVGDTRLFTEQVVELPSGSMFNFVMRPDADLPEPKVDMVPDVLRVAIPAMVTKLNAVFLATLKEISEKAGRKTEFHFWPNMVMTNLYQVAKEIREWLPNSFVYERSTYNQYMRQLQACHVQLGTFPFGGTNSNLDCMLLGIPAVVMEGSEPHERFDGTMMRRVGLPERLICHNREDYVTAAVALMAEDGPRVTLSQFLIHADIHAKFLGSEPEHLKTAFVDAVWKIYKEKS